MNDYLTAVNNYNVTKFSIDKAIKALCGVWVPVAYGTEVDSHSWHIVNTNSKLGNRLLIYFNCFAILMNEIWFVQEHRNQSAVNITEVLKLEGHLSQITDTIDWC